MDGETEILKMGHGGSRAGAGRKPRTVDEDNPHVKFAKAKADRESYRAKIEEIHYLEMTAELIKRKELHEELSTAFATIAQQLRSIPDSLEMTAGISTELAEIIENQIEVCLGELSTKMKKYGSQ